MSQVLTRIFRVPSFNWPDHLASQISIDLKISHPKFQLTDSSCVPSFNWPEYFASQVSIDRLYRVQVSIDRLFSRPKFQLTRIIRVPNFNWPDINFRVPSFNWPAHLASQVSLNRIFGVPNDLIFIFVSQVSIDPNIRVRNFNRPDHFASQVSILVSQMSVRVSF